MNVGHSADILAVYYSRVFPFNEIYEWLNYGDEEAFAFREFAMNFQKVDGEAFLRNQSYCNGDELKLNVKRNRPTKLDIGAVYNISPARKIQHEQIEAVQKELVFDIDLTDYDDVRTCCSDAKICKLCWKYIVLAVKILDKALREDFGFNTILWVFSGRRGIHGWVCDKRARLLNEDARKIVAHYFQLVSGGVYRKKKVEIIGKIHSSVERALTVIEPRFKKFCVEEQNMLGTEKEISKFLQIISKETMRMEVKNLFNNYSTSLARWEAFLDFFKYQIQLESEDWCKTPFLIEEIMIQYAYPRLDMWVTTDNRHLLKCPFCVHPYSKQIGVPLDPESLEDFEPNAVPSIMKLMDEIDTFDASAKKEGMSIDELKEIKDIQKTSLNKYFQIMKKFVLSLKVQK